MSLKNRILSKLRRYYACLVCLILAVSLPLPAVAADVYHYGVAGRSLFACNNNYMPMQTGSGLMCPVRLLLDGGLGLSSVYSEADGYYTLYNTAQSSQYLTFNLNKPGAYDLKWSYDGAEYSILRQNGVYYVPLKFVAERFGFDFDTISTTYGTITRVFAVNDTISDKDLERSISTQLSNAQENYKKMNGIAPTPEPQTPPNVYLGFNADSESDVTMILDILDVQGITATFFVTPEYAERGDIRSIIVREHTLGIRLGGSDDWETLTNTNEVLRLSSLMQTRILRLSPDSAIDRDSLEAGGYRLWEWPLDGRSPDIFKTIDNARNACYVNFGCDDASVEALTALLGQLKALDAEYYAISEAQPPVWS